MSRHWFDLVACGLLLLAIMLDHTRPLEFPVATVNPQGRVIKFFNKTGLTFLDKSSFLNGEAQLTFLAPRCRTSIDVFYLPNSFPETSAARSAIAQAKGRQLTVHDGEVIGGLGYLHLMPRLIWRQLLVAFRLKRPEPWDALVLIVSIPADCDIPHVDWRGLSL